MSQKTNEQVVLDEINTRVKQYMKEHTQKNDQSDEEYYHDFLYQHAGYIDGLYSVLSRGGVNTTGWREYVRAAIDDNKNKNKSKKHKLLFHINQIMMCIQLTKFLKKILSVVQSLHHMVAQLIAKRLVSLTI